MMRAVKAEGEAADSAEEVRVKAEAGEEAADLVDAAMKAEGEAAADSAEEAVKARQDGHH